MVVGVWSTIKTTPRLVRHFQTSNQKQLKHLSNSKVKVITQNENVKPIVVAQWIRNNLDTIEPHRKLYTPPEILTCNLKSALDDYLSTLWCSWAAFDQRISRRKDEVTTVMFKNSSSHLIDKKEQDVIWKVVLWNLKYYDTKSLFLFGNPTLLNLLEWCPRDDCRTLHPCHLSLLV